eukprot:TRINITY_DN1120_c0_g1_i5.p1 TRINITY_DN1120_c0_g1~~TRINITY_DN1120_c0_g1_i5.p1  ORF type:complete len:297 (+),score=95.71 TRINITY_DN1120_c0_g1_i5:51-941(+)
MEERKSTWIDIRGEVQKQITFKDLVKYLDEDKSPVAEDERLDSEAVNFTLNSSTSEDEGPNKAPRAEDASELSLGEMVARSDEIPEFFPNQIEFEPIKGLPGSQPAQLEHKQRSVLKNKHWGKVLRSTYDMGTAEVPKPEHLNKAVYLFIISQEKLKKKREEQDSARTAGGEKARKQVQGHKAARMILKSPRTVLRGLSTVNLRKRKSLIALLSTKESLARTHAASIEVKKRIDKLDKVSKYRPEELAMETKNVLMRMMPYRKEDEAFPPVDNGAEFFKMLNKCIFNEGLIAKWKQ